MHRHPVVALGAYLDAGRLGKVLKDPCRLALGKLVAVEIDAHRDAAIGGARERLDDRPVSQDIGRKVDFLPRGVDQRHVDAFEILGGCIVDGRIGPGWHA
jgi:hypothetical protein